MKTLSWRPGKSPAPEQVKVQVQDTLSGIGANIGHKTVATLIQPQFMSQFCSNHEEPDQQGPILFCQIGHRSDMTPGDEQNVIRRLWIDVFKSDHIFVLVHDLTRYLTRCNFAEQAIIHIHSSLCLGVIVRVGGGSCNNFGGVAHFMKFRVGLYRGNLTFGLLFLLLYLILCWHLGSFGLLLFYWSLDSFGLLLCHRCFRGFGLLLFYRNLGGFGLLVCYLCFCGFGLLLCYLCFPSFGLLLFYRNLGSFGLLLCCRCFG